MPAPRRTPTPAGVTLSEDAVARCAWADSTPDYRAYHDTEWGFPVDEDRRLFEKICLESFQSGLSWLTILRKRENFRSAFANFEYAKVAEFGDDDVVRLLGDAGIVRHRGKIEASINNAGRAVELVAEEGSLAHFVWGHEAKTRRRRLKLGEVPPTSDESRALARELKHRGWKFVGPTTVYAFMQAMGMVNDHLTGCHARVGSEAAREAFDRP